MPRIAHHHRALSSLLLLLGLLWLSIPGARAGEPEFERILFLASDDNRPHQRIFRQFRDIVPGRMIYSSLDNPAAEAWLATRDCHRCLVITSGSRALHQALARTRESRILSITIPHQAFELAMKTHGDNGRVAAIFMDIPLERRAAIAREAIPGLERLAVVESLDPSVLVSPGDSGEATAAGQVEHFVSHGENDLIRTFAQASERADAILTVPDRRVYNPRTIVSIVLTTYREGTPLIAHSESLLRAGALISIHATPEQLGEEAAVLLSELQTRHTPWTAQRRYTQHHEVAVNPHVARSLRIQVAP